MTPLPRLDDLPIPSDATVGTGWSPMMVEIADHIGPYATLKLLERCGGDHFRVSARRVHPRFADAIGEEAAELFCKAFDGSKIDLPTGHAAIWRAKALPILERVRCNALTIADAARILRVARTRIHAVLVEQEKAGAPKRRKGKLVDPRQIDMFSSPGAG